MYCHVREVSLFLRDDYRKMQYERGGVNAEDFFTSAV
jgi:hypothetical protein